MRVRWQRSLAVLAAFGGCVYAQDTVHAVRGDVRYFSMRVGPEDKVVKGAPYTADAVTETVQTLANGTRITRKSTAQLARDSEGRTRREQVIDVVGPWSTGGDAPKIILLHDPVAGVNYHLDPKTSTAVKLPAIKGGLPPLPEIGERFFFASSGEGTAGVAALDKAKAEHMATVTLAAGEAPPHPDGVSVLKMKDPGEVRTESLGQQTLEGVTVTGTRSTRAIAAGAIGNDQPIEIVSESWYSPDLQMVIMSKHSDPQIGETIYRLANIQRDEPAHSLFEVPANYTVREDKPLILQDAAPASISK